MASSGPSTFGRALREHRSRARLTQEELAERAGISARAVSDLERGVNRTARKETGRLLADALGLSGAACASFLRLGRDGDHPARPGPPRVDPAARPRQRRGRALRAAGRRRDRLVTFHGPAASARRDWRWRWPAAPSRRPCWWSWPAWRTRRSSGRRLRASPAGRQPVDAVVAELGPRRLLLVLDNVEHLLPAAAFDVGELLAGCPALRVLVTSRTLLRLRALVHEHHRAIVGGHPRARVPAPPR